MTVLSKTYKGSVQLLGAYLTALYLNPIRTKSFTAATIALLGNLTAQRLSGAPLNLRALSAFGIFGLLFGGTVPHVFYTILTRLFNEDSKLAPFGMLLIERILFMPAYQFFSLYSLSLLEHKSHQKAMADANRFYLRILEANFKYLTLFQFLNLYFVPPMLRVLFNNLIGFVWVIFLAQKRSAPPVRRGKAGRS